MSWHYTELTLASLIDGIDCTQEIDGDEELHTLITPGQFGPTSLVLSCNSSACFTYKSDYSLGDEMHHSDTIM